MRAKSSLRLPRAKELQSNKLEDIQEHLRKLYEELDKQWRLLFQDVSTIQVDADGFIYFGGKDTEGSWRIGRVGNDWQMRRYESGTYVKKAGATA